MGPFSFLRGFSMLAIAASIAPFIFFGLILLMMLGIATVAMGPLIFAFIGMLLLRKWSRRDAREASARDNVIEARVIRDEPPAYPIEAYTPPAHFDLLLDARRDIGRILGAAGAIEDAAIARQFLAVAARADTILTLIIKEPAKLGLARRFFSSYLPRTADLASGYHRLAPSGESAATPGKTAADRRAKLVDVLYRLELAMKDSEAELSAPELARIDADMKLLKEDLKGFGTVPDFTRPPEPILNRVDEIVRSAKRKNS